MFLLAVIIVLPAAMAFIWWRLDRKIGIKEILITEGAVIAVACICFAAFSLGNAYDTELLNGTVASKESSNIHCCHSYQCNCHEVCSSTGKSTSCHEVCSTCYRHLYDVAYTADDTMGNTVYSNSCNPPGTSIPERWKIIKIGEPTSIKHSYLNWIKASKDTIIKRTGALGKWAATLPNYPAVYDYYRADHLILSGVQTNSFKEWNDALNAVNGELGPKKQVDIIMVVANQGDPQYAEAIREQWIGGKKNDFIVVVGAPNFPKIEWVAVLSWSEKEDAKIAVRDRLMELESFDGVKAASIIKEEVESKFVRKEMKDYEYLKYGLSPEPWQWVFTFCAALAVCIGLSILFHYNDKLDD